MKTIGVFFGSRSTEHDISIITGELIISGLKGLGYPVLPVYITGDGHWMIDETLGDIKTFTNASKDVRKETRFQKYSLDLENSVGKMVFTKKGLGGKSITVDLAFPALHGPYGEDGTIQGLFEMLNLPYVGCDVTSSALAMDKALTKQICQLNDIPVSKYVYFYNKDWEDDEKRVTEKIKKELRFPVFVKPVHLGSSIGISKVNNLKDLKEKIEVALYYDNKVLVEEAVENVMDTTCCVIGNEDLQASVLQESVFSADLFDFEEKYLKGGGAQLGKAESGVVIPARVDNALTKSIQETAKAVYRALGCSGIARVDFLVNKKTKEFFAVEVNPLPGTIYHHLWKASGVELDELLKRLVGYADEKYDKKQHISYTFNSNVLSSSGSKKLNLQNQ